MEFKYDLTLPHPLVKDTVRAILSTILFHRLLGSVIPHTRETLGVSYPVVMGDGAGEVDSLVEEKASMLVRALGESASHNKRTQGEAVIAVRFVDQTSATVTRKSGGGGWFGRAEHHGVEDTGKDKEGTTKCWESWVLSIKSFEMSALGPTSGSSSGSSPGNSGGGMGSQGMFYFFFPTIRLSLTHSI